MTNFRTKRGRGAAFPTLPTLPALIAAMGLLLCACGGGGSGGQDGSAVGWNAAPEWIDKPGGSGSASGSGNSGGSALPATGDNTVPIHVDNRMGSINMLSASIKVCVPGSAAPGQCVTVDNMLIDTGSTGVRIAARAIPTIAPLLLTQAGALDDATGAAPIAECMLFASGFTWGSVKRADITIGSKTASNIPIQLMADGAFATPTDCMQHGGADLSTVESLGGNGIIGIDHFTGDSRDALTTAIPANYYYCPSQNNCISTRMLAAKEVTNPVAAFATDNNGTVIRLPALPAGGQAAVTGQLIFGVGTQRNNTLPASATVLAVDDYGMFTTQYKGQVFNRSAIDSGTNAYAFPDSAIPKLGSWYTPATPLTLSATMESNTAASAPLQMPLRVANAGGLMATGYAAFDNIGMYFSNSRGNMFLWGLPFFFGRDVYTVIGYAKVGTLTGPFVAF
ncbi:DUF3443 domain-containing protein [Paraburkholderia sp. BCC1886]|uniref:DUF3443 domain-containing protein n=1 Tax=Paraburkholderia sp. BCC1886 TaxID=2562670 RepID=UPI001642FECF|nr:DUF3443 domain-containing protein [Paraburkholderia sp. BCC1886]